MRVRDCGGYHVIQPYWCLSAAQFPALIGFYVHAAKSLENPRKMLDQAVSEMREDLVKMRQASAEVMSTQKMLESKYGQAQASAVSTHAVVFITSWQMHKAASLQL